MTSLTNHLVPWAGAVSLLCAGAAHADLVVETDLGILPVGTINLMGDTASGANNADYYANTANSDGNWGNELVYQFELGESALVDLTLNGTSGDPDFFLLLDLTTQVENGKNAALFDLDSLFLDDALPDTASFGLLPSGAYYLSVDAFGGLDPPPASPASATFDLDITISAVEPPASFQDLGPIAIADRPLSVDTFGSDFDTLLGVFNSDGFLIGFSDDADATFQSLVDFPDGLPTGAYYVGLGGFDTTYQDGFIIEPQPGSEAGTYTLNYPGGPATGMLAAEEAAWFRFEVAVPEPSTCVLCVIGAVILLEKRAHFTPARRSSL